MLTSVAERGYARTTVPAVVSAARVSRNAFYELFDDKESCFLAVCDGAATEIIESLLPFNDAPAWTEAVAGGVAAYLGWWEARPSFARAYYVELPQAGARALAQRDNANRLFGGIFHALAERARAEQPDLPPLPRLVPRILVYTFSEYVAERVRNDEVAGLTDRAPELAWLTVKLLSDDATAGPAPG